VPLARLAETKPQRQPAGLFPLPELQHSIPEETAPPAVLLPPVPLERLAAAANRKPIESASDACKE
jgi:hypothetical protein